MLSEILIAVGAVLIVAGFLGLKMKTVGKRLIFLCIAGAGMILLSVAEMNTYGLVGGSFQAVYRIIALIPCLMLFHSICKKNEIKDLNGLDGIGTHMPYTYAILVLLAVMCIGVPVTGTFTGIIYSEIGLLAGGFGVFTYIGLIGNVVGVVVPVMLLFPLLRRMYFPCKEQEAEDNTVEIMEEDVPEEVSEEDVTEDAVIDIQSPGKGMIAVSGILAVLLVVGSLWQQPILQAVSTVMQKLFS